MVEIAWIFLAAPLIAGAAAAAAPAAAAVGASWLGGAALGAAGLSAGLGLMGASEQARSLRGQARAKELEARIAELGVKQTAARRMESLVADIGAIKARRATMNISATWRRVMKKSTCATCALTS